MSLDWSIDRVKNFEERCWRENPSDGPGEGKFTLEVDTYALVWGAMTLCIGSIRNNNIDEWDFRVQFLERLNIDWATMWDGEKSVPVYPTREQIADHVGLGTNVSTMARRKWMNQVVRSLELEIEQAQQRAENEKGETA